MKRSSIVGLAAIATFSLIPFGGTPLLARVFDAGKTMAENVVNQPKVELNLSADKQVVQKDETGKEQVTWQALAAGKTVVKPGDVLRYNLVGNNNGKGEAKNLAVTQPIPQGMTYVLNSATIASNNGAAITYSIDNGKSFVEKPTVQVVRPDGKVETKPAPAEAYTHVRWNVGTSLAPSAAVKATYQAKVR
jgi:uncharacterized repeat protein (TIGR01451 family)